jgi:hypothetical protein
VDLDSHPWDRYLHLWVWDTEKASRLRRRILEASARQERAHAAGRRPAPTRRWHARVGRWDGARAVLGLAGCATAPGQPVGDGEGQVPEQAGQQRGGG